MEIIQLTTLQKNYPAIIDKVIQEKKAVLILDNDKSILKIEPILTDKPKTWLGVMKGKGQILGDVISPVSNSSEWDALSQ